MFILARRRPPSVRLSGRLLLGSLVLLGLALAPGEEVHAFRVIDTSGLGLGTGIGRWDAAPHLVGGVERSLAGGLRYSVTGGSYEALRDAFTWSGTPPSVAAFQAAVEDSFAAWESVDPSTGLGTSLSFTADLATPVVQEMPADPPSLLDFVGLNRGAEIDIIANNDSLYFDPGSSWLTAFTVPFLDDPLTVNTVTLTSGVTNHPAAVASGVDIVMNNDPSAHWTLDWFQLILTHEIGHAIGLTDVDVYPAIFFNINSRFYDDNYDDSSGVTALATLTNSFANLIDPLNPEASPALGLFDVCTATVPGDGTTCVGDPGIDTAGVDILMETDIPSSLLGLAVPLQNDDYAGRQFLYPILELTIDWVTVGDPGNACDTQPQGCFGAVAYTYQISRYEVTNAQYAEFLNAVAYTDTYGLYNTDMGSGYGGITRSGSPGSYTYSAIAGREGMPVNYVSFYDALRFANWLHNGQPTGAQDSTTTEDGAYDMSLGSSVVRKAGAQVFLTSEDEWYKAAYYDAGSASYYDYPAGSDTQTTCALPGATANTANCDGVMGGEFGDLTGVGSYTGSASPNGTFDQGGNVWEWNEALISGSNRGLRSGCIGCGPAGLAASFRFGYAPTGELVDAGLRVASLPPPRVPSLGPTGVALLGVLVFAIGVGGLAVNRRRRAL